MKNAPPSNPSDDAAQRWRRERGLLESLLELSPGERASALAELAQSDARLAARITRLLRAQERVGTFLERPLCSLVEADPWIGRRLGPWQIESVLGAGGMGTVYRGRRIDGAFDKTAAVKVMHRGLGSPSLAARFRAERQLLADLEHPGISRLLDGGEAVEGRPYLVMEEVEGRPIDRYCEERGASTEQRLRLALEACQILAFAHRQGVVHCDLKPGHLLVDDAARVRLIDFGIAQWLDRRRPEDDPERPFSPRYASPEQSRGETPTERSDVFSMAKVLQELLGGSLPSGLDRWIGRCLAEDPRHRPTMAAVVEALRDALARPARRRRRRHLISLAAACGLVLSGSVFLLLHLERRLDQERQAIDGASRLLLEQAAFFDPGSGEGDPERWQGLLRSRPRTRGAVLARTARAAANAGRTADARRWLSAALAAWEEGGGANRRDLLDAGEIYLRAGDFSDAERLMLSALRQTDGTGNLMPSVAQRLAATMGAAKHELGQLAQARAWFRRATSADGPALRTADRLEVGRHYGRFLLESGRLLEAREHFKQSLAEIAPTPFAGGVDHAALLIDASKAEARLGQLEEANRQAERAEGLIARTVPAAHPANVTLLRHLAELRYLEGRPQTAVEQAHQALEVSRLAPIPGNFGSALSLATICASQIDMRQLRDARSACREALDRIQRHRGPRHPRTADVRVRLAEIAIQERDLATARKHLEAALDTLKGAEETHHATIGRIYHYQALDLICQGRLREGMALHHRAIGILRATAGDSGPAVAHSIYLLARVLHESGRPALAEPHYQRAQHLLTDALGAEHPRLAWFWRNLARLHIDLDRPQLAKHAARQAVSLAGQGNDFLADEAKSILTL